MSIVRCVVFLFLIPLLGHGQATQEHHQIDLSSQAESPVQMLYQQLVSRPIGAIPKPARMKLFAPYLSNSLLQSVNQARACGEDWFRLHPQGNVKAPLAWMEFGLFSGADDRSGPRAFRIEKMESEKDGSFRAYVRLTGGISTEKPWTWRVAAVVVPENGNFVINDVIFLRDKDINTETRLSEVLTRGCDGSRWIGYTNRQKVLKRGGAGSIKGDVK
jgi:hypothetical protein